MSPETPDVTVVVATRNRARRLEALLRSIEAQTGVDCEVVVVDNGSTDATPELLGRDWPGLRLRPISTEAGAGPAAARNAGWRAAQSDLVVFADDDVEADPGWLAAFVDAHRRRPDAVLQGHTDADPGETARAGPFNRSRIVTGPSEWYPSCNIAYPRVLLEQLGGFNERYGRAWCEDTDLGWRARETGHDAVFVAAARVRHAVHQLGLLGYLRETVRLQDTVTAVADHPELRRVLHRRLFILPEHERLLGLLAGLLLARRTRAASLALAVPYVAGRLRMHDHPAGGLAALPGYVLIDVTEVAAMAIASLRKRTPVL